MEKPNKTPANPSDTQVALDWKTLHSLIGVEPENARDIVFTGVASLKEAGPQEISFLGNPRYQGQVETTGAAVVLVPEGQYKSPEHCHLIFVEDPSTAFSRVVDFFQRESRPFRPGVSHGAIVADDASFDADKVRIGPGAVIEEGVSIGKGTVIGAGCLIGAGVTIGEDCHFHAGAIVREQCQVGNRVILQPACVIGSDGYGFDLVEGRHQKVPQVGIVEIGDEVEVGAHTCIDRARFGKTVIGEGTKIDNLVQIAHNVRIGKHCLLVAQSGIAGSSTLGNYVTIAAQAGVAGHLEIADQTVIATRGGVLKDITEPGVYMGLPARPMAIEQKKMASLARLPKFREEFKQLKKKLDESSGE